MGTNKLSLPLNHSNYKDLIESNCYYVDKTSLLRDCFMEDSSSALLIARPSGFGKSLTLSMFKAFLSLNYADPGNISCQQRLFKNTQILKESRFCEKFMGKFPVIFLSLKSIRADSFDEAYSQLTKLISNLIKEYSFLQESTVLDEYDKQDFNELLKLSEQPQSINTNVTLHHSIRTLIRLLAIHFKRKCILLIDDYDEPLAYALTHGYFKDLFDVLCPIYCDACISNDEYLYKAVLTGTIRSTNIDIAELDKITFNSVLCTNTELAKGFGFTKEDLHALLTYYSLEDNFEELEKQSGGYNFSNTNMFNSYSVVQSCSRKLFNKFPLKEADIKLTASNFEAVIENLIAKLKHYPPVYKKLSDLLEGKAIREKVSYQIDYLSLENERPCELISLLVNTGLITVSSPSTFNVDKEPLSFQIPNENAKQTLSQIILKHSNEYLA